MCVMTYAYRSRALNPQHPYHRRPADLPAAPP